MNSPLNGSPWLTAVMWTAQEWRLFSALAAGVCLRRGSCECAVPSPQPVGGLSPRADPVLLRVAEWPLGGPGQ